MPNYIKKIVFPLAKYYSSYYNDLEMRKQTKQRHFSIFRLISLHMLLGIIILTIIISSFHSPKKIVSQTAIPKNTAPTNILEPFPILPTQTPITPPVLPLEILNNLSPTPTPEATNSAETTEDYCLDAPVVMYHHIQPISLASLLGHAQLTVDSNTFDSQIHYLKTQGYTAISADDLVYALYNRGTLPEKSIVITIDDGYDDNYTYAFMTAKKYQTIMNFMIPTQLIGKPGYMTWDHLREMHQNSYARIYNHTATHAPLGYILKNQIDQELTTSQEDFARELQLTTGIFAYPYGSYNPLAIQILQEHGFIAAFTTDDGTKHCLSNIMQLKRKRVGNALMNSYGY